MTKLTFSYKPANFLLANKLIANTVASGQGEGNRGLSSENERKQIEIKSGLCVAPSRSSYLRCSHPLLTWPIVASRLVASLQSKFAAGTAFSLLFPLSYFSPHPLFNAFFA